MKIYLFRHGLVQETGKKLFLGRTDPPLRAEGRRQAEAWRTHFAGRPAARIAASPLVRALEFARILAGDRAAAVQIAPGLSEIDLGGWDGRAMAEIRKENPAAWKARGADFAGFRPPGGESFGDVCDRVVPAFEQLAAQPGSDLAIVCHAGVNRVILCHLLGMPLANLFRLGQDPGCLNVIEKGAGGYRVVAVNHTIQQ